MKPFTFSLLVTVMLMSSFKNDIPSLKPLKGKLLPKFSTSHTLNGWIQTGSSQIGYYSIPVKATFNYYTELTSPIRNVVMSVNNFNTTHSNTQSQIDGNGGSTEYSISSNLNSSNVNITNNGANATATLTYTSVLKKTVHRPNQQDIVTTVTTTDLYSFSVNADNLPFEIAP